MSMTMLPKMTDKQHRAVVDKAVKKVVIVKYRETPSARNSRNFSDEEIQKAVNRFSKLVLKTTTK